MQQGDRSVEFLLGGLRAADGKLDRSQGLTCLMLSLGSGCAGRSPNQSRHQREGDASQDAKECTFQRSTSYLVGETFIRGSAFDGRPAARGEIARLPPGHRAGLR
jgi:hypothetical protein